LYQVGLEAYHTPPTIPPNTPTTRAPMMLRIIKAGMKAMAAFTRKMTIDQKGMRISTIVTRFVVP